MSISWFWQDTMVHIWYYHWEKLNEGYAGTLYPLQVLVGLELLQNRKLIKKLYMLTIANEINAKIYKEHFNNIPFAPSQFLDLPN